MKQHGLCWEEALRALAVSRAVDQLANDTTTTCVSAAVQKLTTRLQQADLGKHRVPEIVRVTATSKGVPRILQPVPAHAGTPPSQSETTPPREVAKREKREVVEPSMPIPTEITAVADFDTLQDATAKAPVTKNAAKTASTRKRPAESLSLVSSKPETATATTTTNPRKPSRAAKRSRETVLEEECSAKRSCE